jgi:hypothetical protein
VPFGTAVSVRPGNMRSIAGTRIRETRSTGQNINPNRGRPLPTPPLRKETAKFEQETEQPLNPRAAEIAAKSIQTFETKTSPRIQFPIIDRQRALQQKAEQKIEHLRQYSGEHEIEIVETTGERPNIETVVATTTTTLSRPPEVQSPRRHARVDLPALEQSPSKKPS